MLYDGPGMAQQWLRNAGQRIQHYEACDAFQQFVGSRLSDILRIWQQSTTISLVALGIGDSKKARYLLSRIFYSRPHQTIRFIPYDISFDMIADSLAECQRDGLVDVISRANGQILGINDEFLQLRDYRQLMTPAGAQFFCLLGNTLGNEREERRLLEPVYDCMSGEDRLLVEVQLGEQNLQPIEALQAAIQTDKEFYAGPLIVYGAPADNIELQLTREEVFLSDGTHYADSYNATCRFKRSTTLKHPLLKEAHDIPEGRQIQTLTAKRYKADAMASLFSELGFGLACEPLTVETGNRLFGYYCLGKNS
jgi:Histidine-specific methyltransferase, SAM-dependent